MFAACSLASSTFLGILLNAIFLSWLLFMPLTYLSKLIFFTCEKLPARSR